MRIVAGCDGGGTKCEVRVARLDKSNEIIEEGLGLAGGANVNTDFETAIDNITQATRVALAAIEGEADRPIAHFVAALAGSTRVSHDRLRDGLKAELNIQELSIIPDAAILFAAAEVAPPAIATIVGTGSIAWLTAESGEVFRAGGDGPPDGDLGSAFWIGREGVRRGLVRKDLGESPSPSEFADCAPEIFQSTDDAACEELLYEAAGHISELIADVTRQAAVGVSSLSWLCAGGVAVNQRAWMEVVHKRCGDLGLRLPTPIVVPSPVVGALRLAAVSTGPCDRPDG